MNEAYGLVERQQSADDEASPHNAADDTGPSQEAASSTPARPRAFVRDGLLRRVAPFIAVSLAALSTIPFMVEGVTVGAVLSVFAVALVAQACAFVLPWHRWPAWVESVLPIVAIVLVAWIRDVTGGAGSLYGPLFILPMMWLALYSTRIELAIGSVVLFLSFLLPALMWGSPEYPPEQVLRGSLFAGILLVVGFTVQGVVIRVRRGEEQARVMQAQLSRANQELRLADELKNHFVAMASHELRTPLTSIAGFSQVMADRWEELPSEQKRGFVSIIDEQSDRLLRLVDDLLTVSRIAAGEVEARTTPIVLAELIETAIAAVGHSVNITVQCPEHLVAVADRDLLEQVLINFLANAVKYGADPIEIRAMPADGWAEVRVVDHGDGVPESFIPHLFERFSQAPDARHGDRTGSGLGLSIVRGLMTAQGGDAWYEHNMPRGACFVMRVPAGSTSSP